MMVLSERLLATLLGLAAAAVLAAPPPVAVHEPWVREGPPGAAVLAAYMTLANTSDTAQVLSGVSSPSFERVEIHRSVVEQGMARMRPQDELPVAAHSSVALELGGYHLMLIGPKQPLQAGDVVELTLRFQPGGELAVNAPVRQAQAGHAHPQQQPHP